MPILAIHHIDFWFIWKNPHQLHIFFFFFGAFWFVRFLPIDYSVAASRKFFRRLYNRTSFLFFFVFLYTWHERWMFYSSYGDSSCYTHNFSTFSVFFFKSNMKYKLFSLAIFFLVILQSPSPWWIHMLEHFQSTVSSSIYKPQYHPVFFYFDLCVVRGIFLSVP